MTKDRTCECCGKPDFIAGVASSGLGPVSFLWCQICLGVGAEPKYMIDIIFEEENFRAEAGREAFCYFDAHRDNYINYGTEKTIPIKLKDGTEFENRTKYMEYAEKKEAPQ